MHSKLPIVLIRRKRPSAVLRNFHNYRRHSSSLINADGNSEGEHVNNDSVPSAGTHCTLLPRKNTRLSNLKEQLENGPTLQNFIQSVTRSPSQINQRISQEELMLEKSAVYPEVKEEALRDTFGRFHNYLRISITERCNLRCQYCMPADGIGLTPHERLLTTDEILGVAEIFVKLGVTKIRLTGGEPLIRKDIVPLVKGLNSLGLKELAVTTNAVTPGSKLDELLDAGLTHFNVSLDTLQPSRFSSISRRPAKYLSVVLDNIERLLTNPKLQGRVKVNNVIMRGINDDEMVDFVRFMTQDKDVDVRFIEWMPFDSNGWNGDTFFSYQEMMTSLQQEFGVRFVRDVDGPNDTTKWYKVQGHRGRVGFITSMTEQFCGSCNRLRVTADGKLKVCLFGAEELSLRDALRGGKTVDELVYLIWKAVNKKKFALGGQTDMYKLAKSKNRPMILIGG